MNGKSTINEVTRELSKLPKVLRFARKVGRWIWIEFPAKPDDDTRARLKAIGFRWNRRREAWQHPCGVFCKSSPGDPRAKYGEFPLSADEEEPTN